jgi:hypothetical protein
MIPSTPHRENAEDRDREYEADPCAYVEKEQPVFERGSKLDTRDGLEERHFV